MQENILGTEKIGKLLVKFAIPGIIAMLVNALYNIVDQIFIGRGVGFLGNGATNVIFPLTVIAAAIALLFGDGAASYMSLRLGMRDDNGAAKGAAVGILCSLICGIALSIVYLILIEPLCLLFGATPAILPYALDYGRIIAIGVIFSSFACGMSGIIRADGSPRYSMAGLLLGCGLNIILDPLFIFVFDMGVKGAAWATIIGQFANMLLFFFYLPKFKTINLSRKVFKTCFRVFGGVTKLGISSLIQQFVVAISIIVSNRMLTKYGAMSPYGEDIPITAMGVTMKVFNILFAIIIGLSTGAQPIWGYNRGSGRNDRVKQTWLYTNIIATIFLILTFLWFQLAPLSVVHIFGVEDALYSEFAVKCLRIYLALIPVAAAHMIGGVFFQSVGMPMHAMILSFARQVLFALPSTVLLPLFFGVDGVLYAGMLSDGLSFLLSVLLYIISWKKIFPPDSTINKLKST